MMSYIKFLPYIGIAVLAALCLYLFNNGQKLSKHNGELNQQIYTLTQFNKGLTNQLKECNAKIKSTAGAAAVSYGQCADVIQSNSAISFDRGVAFGKATCKPCGH